MVPTSRHTPPVTYHPPPHCGCHVVLDFTRLCPNLSTIPFSHLMGLWVVPGTFKHESGSKGKPTKKMCKFCRFCQFLYFVLRASIKVKYKPTRFDRHFDRNYHLWFNIGLFWQVFLQGWAGSDHYMYLEKTLGGMMPILVWPSIIFRIEQNLILCCVFVYFWCNCTQSKWRMEIVTVHVCWK